MLNKKQISFLPKNKELLSTAQFGKICQSQEEVYDKKEQLPEYLSDTRGYVEINIANKKYIDEDQRYVLSEYQRKGSDCHFLSISCNQSSTASPSNQRVSSKYFTSKNEKNTDNFQEISQKIKLINSSNLPNNQNNLLMDHLSSQKLIEIKQNKKSDRIRFKHKKSTKKSSS